MVGIVAFGGYLPFNRLRRNEIQEFLGVSLPPGEKAVANFDEDSLTMAVAGARDCVRGFDPQNIDAVYFSSTTPPVLEKQGAATIAGVLGTKSTVRTLDIAGSLRAGSAAMLAGVDAALKGEQVLTVVGEARRGAVGSLNDALFGDGAAAFLLGTEEPIAAFLGSVSISQDFYDNWRAPEEETVRTWEERFWQTQGYGVVAEAGKALLAKLKTNPYDFQKVVIYQSKPNEALAVGRKLGFKPEQIQDTFIDRIGNLGSASVLLALGAVLEDSKPGDKIMLITYGDGSDALAFQVTEAIERLPRRRGIAAYLNGPNYRIGYGQYLKWKGTLEVEGPRRPPVLRPSLPDRQRNLKKILGLYGSRCTVCGTPQFPPQRVCVHCHTIDHMEDYAFLDKKAKLATYTLDYLAASIDPPTGMAVVDFEGGGRMVCQMSDLGNIELRVGMELEMTFRKLFSAEGLPVYFWKAAPKWVRGVESWPQD